MSELNALKDVLKEELRDLYSAEHQLTKALPKVIKKASSSNLKDALQEHLSETERQVDRLEKIGKLLEVSLSGKTCKAMKGLIAEGEEIIKENDESSPLVDALLIGAAQRIEHYEMAGYGTARAIAESLGHEDVAELLQETLNEESGADKTLSRISEEDVLPLCEASGEEEVQPRRKNGKNERETRMSRHS